MIPEFGWSLLVTIVVFVAVLYVLFRFVTWAGRRRS